MSENKLVILLDKLKKDILEDKISQEDQENIWNYFNWNKDDPENKDLVKYLFTGWWIYSNLDE